jgi:zinc/manganese transport system ATP-binding protein
MNPRPGSAAVRLRNLTVAYRGHPAVHHLSGTFAAGSLTAIVGPNGAGKTSLLSAMMGRVPAAEGEVAFDAGCAGRVAWLPQQSEIDRSFPIRVFDLVALGQWALTGSFGRLEATQRDAVHRALAAVGLEGFERRGISELSAGQFQRVLFARVLLQDAPVILLDEPFNTIDTRTTADLLVLVRRWHAEQRTVVAVLHDIDQVRAHFDFTLLLARRCIAWGPTPEVLSAANLLRARQVAEAWDERAPICREAA